MSLKPLTLWSHATGPNPWKVAIILEELGLPYETKFIDTKACKEEPYLSLSPNGRMPTLVDPNTDDIVIWESGAIIDYLIGTYDKDAKLHHTTVPEKWQERTWEHFQMSGQGPYFGQLVWFHKFHGEDVPSAKERYINEARRVTGVVELHLSRRANKTCLVGDKVTFADLMFITWFATAVWAKPELGPELREKNPLWAAWLDGLMARPTVVKVMADKAAASANAHH